MLTSDKILCGTTGEAVISPTLRPVDSFVQMLAESFLGLHKHIYVFIFKKTVFIMSYSATSFFSIDTKFCKFSLSVPLIPYF